MGALETTEDPQSRVVDVYFHVQGRQVDVDHGYALYSAISAALEGGSVEERGWLHHAQNVGLALLRGRYGGNGKLMLGKAARFGLRLPAGLIPRVIHLAGKRLQIGADAVLVGVPNCAPLKPSSALYAHIVSTRNGQEEHRFDAEMRRQLELLGIEGNAVRGARRTFTVKRKSIVGYALRVEGLSQTHSLTLQEHGVGGRRKMGCGLFSPAEVRE